MVEKEEPPLFEDDEFKIGYLPYPDGRGYATEDHCLEIKTRDGESRSYVLQRGVLREFARKDVRGLERVIRTVDEMILYTLLEQIIPIDRLHTALSKAYKEEERQRDEFIKAHKAQASE